MKTILKLVSILALVMTLLPSIVFLAGNIDLPTMKLYMLIATLLWFTLTPLWMERSENKKGSVK